MPTVSARLPNGDTADIHLNGDYATISIDEGVPFDRADIFNLVSALLDVAAQLPAELAVGDTVKAVSGHATRIFRGRTGVIATVWPGDHQTDTAVEVTIDGRKFEFTANDLARLEG